MQQNDISRLYVNGSLDAEASVDKHMLQVGATSSCSFNIESLHPYRDNVEDYTVMEVPGAISYTISFDARSQIETSYDFLRFYKGDDHNDFWGEEKYTGRAGEQNFPGFGGRPPLVIPASRFVVYFHSDAQTNDWGYKITCTAEIRDDYVEQYYNSPVELNKAPIYIGQTPRYIHHA